MSAWLGDHGGILLLAIKHTFDCNSICRFTSSESVIYQVTAGQVLTLAYFYGIVSDNQKINVNELLIIDQWEV